MVPLLSLTAATRIGGVIITVSNNKGVLHNYRNGRCGVGELDMSITMHGAKLYL